MKGQYDSWKPKNEPTRFLLRRFEQAIAPGKRSAKVAELIESWIREREGLRQDIIEGCREMGEIYQVSPTAKQNVSIPSKR